MRYINRHWRIDEPTDRGTSAQHADQLTALPAPVVAESAGSDPLLELNDVRIEIATGRGVVKPMDGVSFTIGKGESVALVGESGSGKTMTCLSVMRLLPVRSARIVSGSIMFGGRDLVQLSERRMRGVRGSQIAMIMQDSLSALNPVLTVGEQVSEPVRRHLELSKAGTRERVIEVLTELQIPRPEAALGLYPHQFSGGTRQRIVAAMALAARPRLILADEPTTALDVTVQARFLSLMRDLQRRTGVSVLWVTHDLGLVAQVCDRVNVMYAGQIVETGSVRRLFKDPRHPYTRALMASVPKVGEPKERLEQIEGQPPDLMRLPQGCSFQDRCPARIEVCAQKSPVETTWGENNSVRCWHEAMEQPSQVAR